MDSDQLAEFRRTGVVVIPDLFDEHEVEAMRCEADAIGAVALNSMLFHNRPGGRAGLGFDESGAVSLLKLQPFQKAASAGVARRSSASWPTSRWVGRQVFSPTRTIGSPKRLPTSRRSD